MCVCIAEEDTKDKGKLYKPTSKLADLMPLAGKAKVKTETREPPSLREARTSSVAASSAKLRSPGEKRKSQLEIFKEELRAYGFPSASYRLTILGIASFSFFLATNGLEQDPGGARGAPPHQVRNEGQPLRAGSGRLHQEPIVAVPRW